MKRLALMGAVCAMAVSGTFGAPRASAARMHWCPAGGDGAVSTLHTSCAEARRVLGKALAKIPLPEFRVYVHGWWHCSYGEIAGHGTFTAERMHGTPQRQVVIVVT